MAAKQIIPEDLPSLETSEPPRAGTGAVWWALAVVGVVIAVGTWWVRQQADSPPTPATEGAPPASPAARTAPPSPSPVENASPTNGLPEGTAVTMSTAEKLLAKERAESALSGYLEAKRTLDELAVQAWGGSAFAEILAQVHEADNQFSAEDYLSAAGSYEVARQAAAALAAGADEAFVDLVNQGHEALARADGPTAQNLFDAALAIRADDETARIGSRRAATIDQASALFRTGLANEKDGLYELAMIDFGEALQLDPHFDEIKGALQRVEEQLRDTAFQDAMSGALEALKEKAFPKAREYVLQAQALKPEAPEVRDALYRITEAERAERINTLHAAARVAEAAEKWDEAHAVYREILAIDTTIEFARDGADRCSQYRRLTLQMAQFADQLELLAAPEARASARNLLAEVESLTRDVPGLEALATRLARALTLAETKVPVRLRSDGSTRVDVYQVGRFPPFKNQTLELLPGSYTIVGHRDGFRDVRLELRVPPGEESVQATVICRERI